MCGIAGIIAPKATAEWKAQMMDRLLLAAQKRGDDATGIAYIDPTTKEMKVIKDGVAASSFVYKDENYLAARDNLGPIVIGHCRAATKKGNTGSDNNANNHPFFAKESGIALIHNGLISDDERWRQTVGKPNGLRNKPESEVDSEVMLMAIETFFLEGNAKFPTMEDAINDACFNVAGSYALAILKQDEPNKLWLVKHNNPVTIAWLPDEEAIVFGSTEDIVTAGITDWKCHLDYFMEDVTPIHVMNTMAEHSMISIELIPNVKKAPFVINQTVLDCATTEYKHHRAATPVHQPAAL